MLTNAVIKLCLALCKVAFTSTLRQTAAEQLVQLDLPGYAIGGVSVGEPPELIEKIVQATTPLLPPDKPRYLMGVGTYREMAQAIAAGMDLFDCVIPTRLAPPRGSFGTR